MKEKELFNQAQFNKEVAQKMYAVMYIKKRGISVREFANKIGVSPATVSRIFNDKKPDIETFFKFCKWMGKSPNKFYNK